METINSIILIIIIYLLIRFIKKIPKKSEIKKNSINEKTLKKQNSKNDFSENPEIIYRKIEIDDKTSQIIELKKKYESLLKSAFECQKVKNTQTANIKNLHKQIDILKNNEKNLQEIINSKNIKINELQEEVNSLTNTINSLTKTIKKVQVKNNSLSNIIEKQRKIIKNKKSKISILEADKFYHKNSSRHFKELNDSKSTTINELQKIINSQKDNIKELQYKNNELEKKNKELEYIIKKRDELLNNLKERTDSSISKITSLYSDFLTLHYRISSNILLTKKRPAKKEAYRIQDLRKESRLHIERYKKCFINMNIYYRFFQN